jgi:hypothetical protein
VLRAARARRLGASITGAPSPLWLPSARASIASRRLGRSSKYLLGRQRPVSRLRFYGRETRADADIASTHREQHQAWFMPICLLRHATLAYVGYALYAAKRAPGRSWGRSIPSLWSRRDETPSNAISFISRSTSRFPVQADAKMICARFFFKTRT